MQHARHEGQRRRMVLAPSGGATSSDPSGSSVNGMRVDAPRAKIGQRLVLGQDVQIVGTAILSKLSARRINPAPARPFSSRVEQLSAEGYVMRRISGVVAIGQVPITRLPASARIRAGDRVIFDGPDRRERFAPTRLRQPRVKLEFPSQPRRRTNAVSPAPRQQVLPPPPDRQTITPTQPRIYRSPTRGLRK